MLPSLTSLWQPDHSFHLITLSGAPDVDGDPLVLNIVGASHHEPVEGLGEGDTFPDAVAGANSNTVSLRVERGASGDGRVYVVSFEDVDGAGGQCTDRSRLEFLRPKRPRR